jgi:enoyl-[acyl-carrier protein] reductase II
VGDTAFVGRGKHPIRQLRNAFSAKYEAAERRGASREELDAIFESTSLKRAALEGDMEWGKIEAGQSAGLVTDIVPAGELFKRLVAEMEEARRRLAAL